MSNNTYNGWTNWQTWNVLIWLDNEQNLYNAKESFIRRNEHKQNFEIIVKSFLTDIFPNGTPDMKTAEEMEAVNYEEIAETWQEEYEFENK
tara:strand:+ start:281 stop:553 length:273 start_codon:yes stop_codon:yes gene_type:complete